MRFIYITILPAIGQIESKHFFDRIISDRNIVFDFRGIELCQHIGIVHWINHCTQDYHLQKILWEMYIADSIPAPTVFTLLLLFVYIPYVLVGLTALRSADF